jgi:hypothetical protein
MSEGETNDLSARIAEESASLPPEKQSAVLDYVLAMKRGTAATSAPEEDGDAAWERIINDPRPRPKLETFMKASLEEGSEPMDFDRL